MDAVDIEKSLRAEASDDGCSGCNVCDGSARIGGCTKSNKPSVGVEQILKMAEIEEAAVSSQVHPG